MPKVSFRNEPLSFRFRASVGFTMGTMTASSHHAVALSIRPARVSTLIPPWSLEGNWRSVTSRVIENYARKWGGAGDLYVPCPDLAKVPEPFWRILRTFDADYHARYLPTRRGQQMVNPEAFERSIEVTIDEWVKERPETDREQSRKLLKADHILNDPVSTWYPEPLDARIQRELAPMVSTGYGLLSSFHADGTGDRFVDISVLNLPSSKLVNLIPARNFDESLALALATRVGAISPSFRAELERLDIAVVDIPISKAQTAGVLDLVWHGWESQQGWPLHWEIAEAVTDAGFTEPINSAFELLALTPFGLSMHGLSVLHPTSWKYDRPFVFIAGDTHDDFCLWAARDRMYWDCGWLPTDPSGSIRDSEFLQKIREQLTLIVRNGPGADRRRVILASSSLDISALEALRGVVGLSIASEDLTPQIEVMALEQLEMARPRRLFDPGFVDKVRYEAFVDEVQAGKIVAPMPTKASTSETRGFTWFVDARADDWRTPARTILNELVTSGSDFERWGARSGSEGVSFLSQNMGFSFAGTPIEENLASIRLRLPTAREVISQLIGREQLRMAPSAAGQFLAGHLQMWNSLESAVSDLTSSPYAVLSAFRSTKLSGAEPGIYLKSVSRRFLSFEDVASVGGLSVEDTRHLIDAYIRQGVFRRGLILLCERCSFSSWYDLEDLSQNFRCGRCRQTNSLDLKAWKMPANEPRWYYQLDEVIHQSLSHNNQIPILALSALSEKAKSFHFLESQRIFANGNEIAEVDFFAIVDGLLFLGEAKIGSKLASGATAEKTCLRKLARVSDALTADFLVLATGALKWSERTVAASKEIFESKTTELRLIDNLTLPEPD